MAHSRRPILLSLLLLPAALAATAPTTQDTQPRRGTYQTTFSEHSPLTATKKDLAKRFTPAPTYDLSATKFTIHVPDSYDGTTLHGILVAMMSRSEDKPPATWLATLARQRLIFVIFADYPAKDALQAHASLAADAVHNLRQTYRIDDRRIYTVGDSMAEATALYFPDVFTAGLFLGDVGHCRPVFIDGVRVYEPKFPAPQGVAATRVKDRRYAFCADDTGYAKNIADAFRRDLTRNVDLVPFTRADDPGYDRMTSRWLEQAIATFDAHLPPAPKSAPPAPARPAEALTTSPATTTPARPAAPAPSEPQRLLSMARSYVANGAYAAARTRLNALVTKYPADPAAAEAATLLDQIKDK